MKTGCTSMRMQPRAISWAFPRKRSWESTMVTLCDRPLAVDDLRQRALAAGSYTDETEFVRQDKSRRQIEFTIVTNFREGHHLIVMRDITSRRTMERQLDQAQKLEAVGQLAGGVAHDFNNMLTAIRGYAELLQRKLTDGQHSKYIEGILGATDRATQTTRQLLAF